MSDQVVRKLGTTVLVLGSFLAGSHAALAAEHEYGDVMKHISHLFNSATGWQATSQADLSSLVKKAQNALQSNQSFEGLFEDDAVEFAAANALGDEQSTTVKFTQKYKGLEVVGNEAMVHFDSNGDIEATTGGAISAALDVEARLSPVAALELLNDRYQQRVSLSRPAELQVLKDFEGRTHLVYHMLTKSTATHDGQEVFLDAHSGTVVLETDRAFDALAAMTTRKGGKRTVYNADTDEAHKPGRVDTRGYPTDIDVSWYEKVAQDGKYTDGIDRSATNAYRNAGKVYDYYKKVHDRKSYDDKDSRIVSVVHMGVNMNNAFWTGEYEIMGYGDGDGQTLVDLTYGLDVAAHELTHGVTANTANLVYAAEAGALNESYSDFFGKMVDYTEGDWDIGARIMAKASKRRALRNMENPEEFRQPGSNDSPLRKPTTGVECNSANDRCGVHANSGIPNRAAALIVKAIGKENAEKLYYRVLTRHLSRTSTFADARAETEKACELMFGKGSEECQAVTKAYDTVKM